MKKLLGISLFSSFILGYSQVGINTSEPKGALHIFPKGNEETLIISNIKDTEESLDTMDGDTPSYLNLKISDKGVIRRETPPNPDKSLIFDLAEKTTIDGGKSDGSGGSILKWVELDNLNDKYITLPETGAYIFSFRLYGKVTTTNAASTHYISSWKEGSNTPFDIAEINIIAFGATAASTLATYSVNLTISGRSGDRVYFKISYYDGGTNPKIGWTLGSNPGNYANKTSMIYWKL